MKKIVLNFYFVTAIVISGFIFFLSYQLRSLPMYEFTKTFRQVLNDGDLSHRYSKEYIQTIKAAYFLESKSLFRNGFMDSIPEDSIFMISLRQIIKANAVAAGDRPIVTYGQDKNTMISHFHVKENENFDIIITFQKVNGIYVFEEITNFRLLLHYHPENAYEMKRFGSID